MYILHTYYIHIYIIANLRKIIRITNFTAVIISYFLLGYDKKLYFCSA